MSKSKIGAPRVEMAPPSRGVNPSYISHRNRRFTYPAIFPISAYHVAFHQHATGSVSRLSAGTDTYRVLGKRVLDIVLVSILAPLAVLMIGIAALLLWVEGGTPFYRQQRLGKGGDTFSILKLRTMVKDADQMLERHLAADPALRAEWNSTQKLKSDPRITRVGALLRKTSLDELPQLWNVLKGDMSLVGPRPMLPEQLPLYGDAAHYFALRPGITGYWQVSQRNEGSFVSRVALDADYNFNLSPCEDAKVLLRTFGAVIKRTGY
ncbi:sugar transferase [Roseovarius dicentrarchi]|uniref:sugar transferase n=1 Tax=Roseovarius dicentrarchi TaxID=2250573 RepID=UPI001EF049E2|nr:sugar transferase [Roseovarius dicentrarchi]